MTHTTRSKMWRLAGPLVGVLGLAGAGSAQPNGNEAPMAQNPPNWNNGGARPDFRNMTPEQRQAAMAQMRERFLRQGLTQLGFPQADIQDALLEFIAAQDVATRPLQEKSRALLTAMLNKESTEAQIATLATDVRTTADAERARRVTALADLDTSISYTKNPRLLALLQIAGIAGDQGSLLSAPGASLMQLMGGGQGGRGGQGVRGGRGGRGGQNGGQNNQNGAQ